jgi:hypothetical protein
MASPPLVRWYSSFYWRIGISFVVSVIVVLVAQSLMVGYARSAGAFAPGNPNATALAIADRNCADESTRSRSAAADRTLAWPRSIHVCGDV